MILKEKYDVVNRWAAVKVMGWHKKDGDTFEDWFDSKERSVGYSDLETLPHFSELWNPCEDLNSTKMVVDRLDYAQLPEWFLWMRDPFVSETPYCKNYINMRIANAPADLRMEAVIKVFYPDKTIEEAIQEMEKEIC